MILPFGTGGRCADRITSGCAAATAASKIARRSGRRSVMASRFSFRSGTGQPLSLPLRQKKTPADWPAGVCRGLRLQKRSAADLAADDVAEQHPAFALEHLQLKLANRGEIGARGVDLDAGQQHLGAVVLQA